ncbi:hypothetical protein GMRT_15556 [Giardia muris]|uniref:Uncharacterized protein n=1 Tax=Giardia muris TaxID=5742 RepID=A0A4Z1SSD1_GIAMU|nr:hypothetical protein GMRT_15556 [Giardia muris]|eukprot:TNJ28852.1 hypothetical protein GMRT_15556 [Giardia muris]
MPESPHPRPRRILFICEGLTCIRSSLSAPPGPPTALRVAECLADPATHINNASAVLRLISSGSRTTNFGQEVALAAYLAAYPDVFTAITLLLHRLTDVQALLSWVFPKLPHLLHTALPAAKRGRSLPGTTLPNLLHSLALFSRGGFCLSVARYGVDLRIPRLDKIAETRKYIQALTTTDSKAKIDAQHSEPFRLEPKHQKQDYAPLDMFFWPPFSISLNECSNRISFPATSIRLLLLQGAAEADLLTLLTGRFYSHAELVKSEVDLSTLLSSNQISDLRRDSGGRGRLSQLKVGIKPTTLLSMTPKALQAGWDSKGQNVPLTYSRRECLMISSKTSPWQPFEILRLALRQPTVVDITASNRSLEQTQEPGSTASPRPEKAEISSIDDRLLISQLGQSIGDTTLNIQLCLTKVELDETVAWQGQLDCAKIDTLKLDKAATNATFTVQFRPTLDGNKSPSIAATDTSTRTLSASVLGETRREPRPRRNQPQVINSPSGSRSDEQEPGETSYSQGGTAFSLLKEKLSAHGPIVLSALAVDMRTGLMVAHLKDYPLSADLNNYAIVRVESGDVMTALRLHINRLPTLETHPNYGPEHHRLIFESVLDREDSGGKLHVLAPRGRTIKLSVESKHTYVFSLPEVPDLRTTLWALLFAELAKDVALKSVDLNEVLSNRQSDVSTTSFPSLLLDGVFRGNMTPNALFGALLQLSERLHALFYPTPLTRYQLVFPTRHIYVTSEMSHSVPAFYDFWALSPAYLQVLLEQEGLCSSNQQGDEAFFETSPKLEISSIYDDVIRNVSWMLVDRQAEATTDDGLLALQDVSNHTLMPPEPVNLLYCISDAHHTLTQIAPPSTYLGTDYIQYTPSILLSRQGTHTKPQLQRLSELRTALQAATLATTREQETEPSIKTMTSSDSQVARSVTIPPTVLAALSRTLLTPEFLGSYTPLYLRPYYGSVIFIPSGYLEPDLQIITSLSDASDILSTMHITVKSDTNELNTQVSLSRNLTTHAFDMGEAARDIDLQSNPPVFLRVHGEVAQLLSDVSGVSSGASTFEGFMRFLDSSVAVQDCFEGVLLDIIADLIGSPQAFVPSLVHEPGYGYYFAKAMPSERWAGRPLRTTKVSPATLAPFLNRGYYYLDLQQPLLATARASGYYSISLATFLKTSLISTRKLAALYKQLPYTHLLPVTIIDQLLNSIFDRHEYRRSLSNALCCSTSAIGILRASLPQPEDRMEVLSFENKISELEGASDLIPQEDWEEVAAFVLENFDTLVEMLDEPCINLTRSFEEVVEDLAFGVRDPVVTVQRRRSGMNLPEPTTPLESFCDDECFCSFDEALDYLELVMPSLLGNGDYLGLNTWTGEEFIRLARARGITIGALVALGKLDPDDPLADCNRSPVFDSVAGCLQRYSLRTGSTIEFGATPLIPLLTPEIEVEHGDELISIPAFLSYTLLEQRGVKPLLDISGRELRSKVHYSPFPIPEVPNFPLIPEAEAPPNPSAEELSNPYLDNYWLFDVQNCRQIFPERVRALWNPLWTLEERGISIVDYDESDAETGGALAQLQALLREQDTELAKIDAATSETGASGVTQRSTIAAASTDCACSAFRCVLLPNQYSTPHSVLSVPSHQQSVFSMSPYFEPPNVGPELSRFSIFKTCITSAVRECCFILREWLDSYCGVNRANIIRARSEPNKFIEDSVWAYIVLNLGQSQNECVKQAVPSDIWALWGQTIPELRHPLKLEVRKPVIPEPPEPVQVVIPPNPTETLDPGVLQMYGSIPITTAPVFQPAPVPEPPMSRVPPNPLQNVKSPLLDAVRQYMNSTGLASSTVYKALESWARKPYKERAQDIAPLLELLWDYYPLLNCLRYGDPADERWETPQTLFDVFERGILQVTPDVEAELLELLSQQGQERRDTILDTLRESQERLKEVSLENMRLRLRAMKRLELERYHDMTSEFNELFAVYVTAVWGRVSQMDRRATGRITHEMQAVGGFESTGLSERTPEFLELIEEIAQQNNIDLGPAWEHDGLEYDHLFGD